jgi:diaminopimelate decarboxylase
LVNSRSWRQGGAAAHAKVEAMSPPSDGAGQAPTLPTARIVACVQRARAAGWLDDAAPAIVVHDLTRLDARLSELAAAFPARTLHAIAIKANPLVPILRRVVAAGHGLEAASWEEVELARAAGCRADRIVFDSPAKTVTELRAALELGVHLNADNLDELRRIEDLSPPSGASIGLRINPQVGAGTIATTSVADVGSRFGLPWPGHADALVEIFARHRWLTAIHAHVGSQGVSLDQLVAAAARLDEVRRAIDGALGAGRIRVVDIGGGLSADYGFDEPPPGIDAYAARVRAEVPGLFEPPVRLVTELGRSVQAGCGFAVSRVEYVKEAGGRRLATIHLGADMFLRLAYQPQTWRNRITVLAADGTPKPGPSEPWTLVGPLCFAGDVVASDRPLPRIEAGDLIVIHDVGAYTMGMWSRHCSRAPPPTLGLDGDTLGTLAPRRSVSAPTD